MALEFIGLVACVLLTVFHHVFVARISKQVDYFLAVIEVCLAPFADLLEHLLVSVGKDLWLFLLFYDFVGLFLLLKHLLLDLRRAGVPFFEVHIQFFRLHFPNELEFLVGALFDVVIEEDHRVV